MESHSQVDIPDKIFFKIGEVSDLAGVKPYVLRYWETEFSIIPHKSGSGQRLYRRKDIERILLIKRLLYQEGYTIAGARKYLARYGRGGVEINAAVLSGDLEETDESPLDQALLPESADASSVEMPVPGVDGGRSSAGSELAWGDLPTDGGFRAGAASGHASGDLDGRSSLDGVAETHSGVAIPVPGVSLEAVNALKGELAGLKHMISAARRFKVQ